jgi:sn-glycerol 3-phosphate transport system ATP-binding protein
MAAVTLRRVKKNYGSTTVVHGVDLEINAGEFVVILGPSGCGKSTLLRMIAGLEAITDGEIAIGEKIVNTLEPRERGCAMVFQNYALYPHMTVAENIGYALKVAGLAKAERQARIKAVGDMLGLTEFLERKPMQLSGGQRQRVAMGRAMIREPDVFLYDEPLSNLDARLRVAMRVEIRRLHQRLGTTSLFVTHDQVEAMTLADRIVVMNKGVIEQVGTPDDVYHRPASTYVAGFVGSPGLNLLHATVDRGAHSIRFKDGQSLALDQAQYTTLPDGPIVFGFRAEQTQLVEQGGLKITSSFNEALGSSRLLHGLLADEEAVISIPGDQPFSVASSINVTIPAKAMHFFDAESGRRIG